MTKRNIRGPAQDLHARGRKDGVQASEITRPVTKCIHINKHDIDRWLAVGRTMLLKVWNESVEALRRANNEDKSVEESVRILHAELVKAHEEPIATLHHESADRSEHESLLRTFVSAFWVWLAWRSLNSKTYIKQFLDELSVRSIKFAKPLEDIGASEADIDSCRTICFVHDVRFELVRVLAKDLGKIKSKSDANSSKLWSSVLGKDGTE